MALDTMRWMEWFARVHPLTDAIGAMRSLVLDGWTPAVGRDFVVLALAAGLCLVLGTREFNRQTGDRAR